MEGGGEGVKNFPKMRYVIYEQPLKTDQPLILFIRFPLFSNLQGIMKDKWMNMGYEEDELKPFIEPIADFSDEKRIETLVIFTSK